MVARLTLTEKEQLIQEERKRRAIVRKQQVRAQADEYSRQVREIVKRRSTSIAKEIRKEVAKEVNFRLNYKISPRSNRVSPRFAHCPKTPLHQNARKTPQRPNNSLTKAFHRGSEALKRLRKARRSQELKKDLLLSRRKAAKEHFNKVSREGAENVPMMQ